MKIKLSRVLTSAVLAITATGSALASDSILETVGLTLTSKLSAALEYGDGKNAPYWTSNEAFGRTRWDGTSFVLPSIDSMSATGMGLASGSARSEQRPRLFGSDVGYYSPDVDPESIDPRIQPYANMVKRRAENLTLAGTSYSFGLGKPEPKLKMASWSKDHSQVGLYGPDVDSELIDPAIAPYIISAKPTVEKLSSAATRFSFGR